MRTAVVQIAFAEFGPEPLRTFVDSYIEFNSGIDHRLVIACKGFATELPEEFRAIIARVPHMTIDVPNEGYDIGTYRRVCEALEDFDYFIFFNSRSRLLAPQWGRVLSDAGIHDRIGMISATASTQSLLSDFDHIHRPRLGLRTGSRAVLQASALNRLRHRLEFPPFPNPHLRTNGFAIRRDRFLQASGTRIRTKRQAAYFENGRNSISNQLRRGGLELLVAGRDGRAFRSPEWESSGTFWQENQQNLLVADNQTDRYEAASTAERAELFQQAWRHPAERTQATGG